MLDFITGELVAVNDRTMTVTKRTADGQWLLEDHDNGATMLLTETKIVKMLGAQEMQRLKAANDTKERAAMMRRSFDSYDPELQVEARRRRGYIGYYLENGPNIPFSKKLKGLLVEAAANMNDPNPPKYTTFHKWWKLWQAGGARDIRSLIPGTKSRGRRGSRLDENALQIIEDAIKTRYMTTAQHSMRDAYHEVKAGIAEWNEKHPDQPIKDKISEFTVRRLIKLRAEYDRMKARRGKTEADHLFKFVHGRAQAERPLEVVEIDHTRVNLIITDEETGFVLDRLWLTVAIDRATRMIVGLYLGAEGPSVEAVMGCLHNMIRPKDYVPDLLGKPNVEWPCFGIPETIVMDNGVEFHSEHFQDALAQLGIQAEYAPVKQPEYKGKVERLFRTINTQVFNVMPGTTRSGIEDRGNLDPIKNACIGYTDLNKILHKWVVEEYPQTFHTGLQAVPLEVWKKKVAKYPVTPPPSDSDLAILLMAPDVRTLQHYGLSFETLHYNSPRLSQIFRQERHRKIQIRVDITDLGTIYFLDPDTGHYEPAFALASTYANGLTLRQHKAIRKLANEQANDVVRLADLVRIKRERWADIAEAAAHGGKRRKAAEKAKAQAQQAGMRPVTPVIKTPVMPVPTTVTTTPTDLAARAAARGISGRRNKKDA